MVHRDIEGIDTYGASHQDKIEILMNLMLQLHEKKSVTYKGSWIKRGFRGAFYTFVRPWDRIESIIESDMDIVNKTFFEACVDLALYLIKMAVVISDKDPKIMNEWISEEKLEYNIDSGLKLVGSLESPNVAFIKATHGK